MPKKRQLILCPRLIAHIDHIDAGLTVWARDRGGVWFVEIDEPGHHEDPDVDTLWSYQANSGLGGLFEEAEKVLADLPPDLIFKP